MSDTLSHEVTLTDIARDRVKALFQAQGLAADVRLRIEVKLGGCAGFQYDLFPDEELAETDLVRDFDGLEVVVDQKSANYLVGATIDFEDTIMKQGLTIDNPNATGSCACGSSFN